MELQHQQPDDASDRSPMPLTISPPLPTKIGELRISNLRAGDGNSSHDDDDGSSSSILAALSLPEPPSSYSPPPSSVFSEDDLPVRSVRSSRFPLHEVHFDEEDHHHHHNVGDFATPLPNSRPTPSSVHALTPNTASPNFVIPAIKSLKTNLQESHQSLYLLQEENKALTAECQNYQSTLQTQQQTITRLEEEMIAKEERWAADLSLLESEKQTLESELESMQQEVKSMANVKYQLDAVANEKAALQKKLDCLEQQSADTSKSLQLEKEQLASLLKEMTARAEAAESERVALLEQLQETQQQVNSKLHEAELQTAAVEEENCLLKASLSEAESSLASESTRAKEIAAELLDQVTSLSEELAHSKLANDALTAELAAIKKDAIERVQSRADTACQTIHGSSDAAVQTASDSHGLATLIMPSSSFASASGLDSGNVAERLGRIRDATERATILQDMRRQISHLKLEHQTELRKLEQEHDVALRKVILDAKTELRTKTEKHKLVLKNEYEAKLDALEQRHQAELDEAKEECERTVRISEETIQAAVAEVEVALAQLEAERSRTQELEERLLSFDWLQEERQYKRVADAAENATLKENWKSETETLAERIRSACNTVIEDHVAELTYSETIIGNNSFPPTSVRRQAALPSPLSVNDPASLWSPHFSSGKRFFGDHTVFRLPAATTETSNKGNVPLATTKSSSALVFSSADLDQTLAETESMVMRLMNMN